MTLRTQLSVFRFLFSSHLFVSRFLRISFETREKKFKSIVRSHTWNLNFRFHQTLHFGMCKYISSISFVNRLIIWISTAMWACISVCWFYYSFSNTFNHHHQPIECRHNNHGKSNINKIIIIIMTTAKRNCLATLLISHI